MATQWLNGVALSPPLDPLYGGLGINVTTSSPTSPALMVPAWDGSVFVMSQSPTFQTLGIVDSIGFDGLGYIKAAASQLLQTYRLECEIPTGSAPLIVSSTTKVTNLNADKVDGFDLDQSVLVASTPRFAGLGIGKAGASNQIAVAGSLTIDLTSNGAVIIQNAAIGEKLRLKDGGASGTGTACYVTMYDAANTRTAFFGLGSSTNNDFSLTADSGGVRLLGGTGAIAYHITANVPGATPMPASGSANFILGGPATSPVLANATADMVMLAPVDNGAGNRELQIQPESGTYFALGAGVFRVGTGSLTIKSGSSSAAQFDADATAGNTRFLLWDVSAGTLKRVSIGASDSGGTGFKVLRVPN